MYSVSQQVCNASAPLPTDLEKRMGIEIETSAIKTNAWGRHLVISKKRQPFLILEGDTTDVVFRESEHTSFNKNVECHTIDGLAHEEIMEATEMIQMLLSQIHEMSSDPSHITVDAFKTFLPPGFNPLLKCKESCSTLSFLSAKSGSPPLIRPQITFQIPLSEIPNIFIRLARLGHLSSRYLLSDLSPDEAFVIPTSTEVSHKFFKRLTSNRDKALPLRKHFKERIAADLASLPSGPVKGLVFLFLHYWYELFNEKDNIGREPGLKQYLGVMSRIPFSQLYDSLNPEEQAGFCSFIDSHLPGDIECNLRSYKDFDSDPIVPTLSIRRWYQSIIDPAFRKRVDKGGGIVIEVDSLSPPDSLPESYSMGYFDIDSIPKSFVLIEGRGYSSLMYKGSPITLENLRNFVADEAAWFF